jgi:bifunctional non-homologous end joining protein LigD
MGYILDPAGYADRRMRDRIRESDRVAADDQLKRRSVREHSRREGLERELVFLKIDGVLDPPRFPLQIVKRVPAPFNGADWLFEVKHDGFRVLAIRDCGPPRLYTRNGYDISYRHQHIIAALAAIPTERFVLDRELIVLDDDGRSNFPKLARGRTGTHYYCFDLLVLGNADVRAKPLDLRKVMLANLLQGCAESVRYCDHIVGIGESFFEAVREAELEGMVAKRRGSEYTGGLNDDWLKIKCLRVHDFVIGGWISNPDKHIGALLLGEFVQGNLRYVFG